MHNILKGIAEHFGFSSGIIPEFIPEFIPEYGRVRLHLWFTGEATAGMPLELSQNCPVECPFAAFNRDLFMKTNYDANHQIRNVVFDNFYLDGEKVTNADQLDLYIKQAGGVKFK